MMTTRGMDGGGRRFLGSAFAIGAVGAIWALAGAGCAGGETGGDPGGGSGGSDPGPSASSSGGSGGAGGSGMGGAGGSGMGGAGGSGMGGAGGSGGSGSNLLYPLEPGATWTYDVTPIAGGAMCDPGTHQTAVVSTKVLDGRNAFEVDSFCTGIQQTSFLSNLSTMSDQVDIHDGAAWAVFLAAPMKDGQTWMTPTASYTWYFVDKVTVPAGSFSNCWKAQENFIEGESYTIYCPGVGPVRAYLAGGIVGSGFDAKLTNTSLLP